MQFETSVSMMSMPSLSGRAPMPPAASSLATNGRPVSGSRPPNAITSSVPEFAAGIFPGSAPTSAPRIVSAMRLMVAVRQLTGAGAIGLTIVPSGQHRVHRAEAAAVVRNRGVGDRAHGVVHRRHRRGRHGVERPAHLRVAAREVEGHRRAAHAQRHRDLHRRADHDAVVVEPVLERIVAVRDLFDLLAREALRARQQFLDVREHRRGAVRGEQLAQPHAARAGRPPPAP